MSLDEILEERAEEAREEGRREERTALYNRLKAAGLSPEKYGIHLDKASDSAVSRIKLGE